MTTMSDEKRTRAPKVGRGTSRTTEPATDSSAKRDVRIRNATGLIAMIAVVAALACAVFFGYRAYEAYFVQQPIQSARDEAVGSAEQAMINVTTINPKDMSDWNARLEGSFAGDALDQVQQQVKANLTPQLAQAGNNAGSTSARVVRSAPTQVNADEGKAEVLVYLAVTGQTPGQASVTPKTMGFLVGMTKIGDTWKATKVSVLDGIELEQDGSQASAAGSPPAGSPATDAPATNAPAGGN